MNEKCVPSDLGRELQNRHTVCTHFSFLCIKIPIYLYPWNFFSWTASCVILHLQGFSPCAKFLRSHFSGSLWSTKKEVVMMYRYLVCRQFILYYIIICLPYGCCFLNDAGVNHDRITFVNVVILSTNNDLCTNCCNICILLWSVLDIVTGNPAAVAPVMLCVEWDVKPYYVNSNSCCCRLCSSFGFKFSLSINICSTCDSQFV